jgi:hypothetical protein
MMTCLHLVAAMHNLEQKSATEKKTGDAEINIYRKIQDPNALPPYFTPQQIPDDFFPWT